MSDVAIARINTFGPSPKADFESPSEQLIVLTYAQLQNFIKGAIEQAIQPLQDEIAQLREEIDQDRQEIAALRLKMASLEKDRDTLSENQLIQLRLIHELKEKVNQESPAPTKITKKTEDHIQSIVNALHAKEKKLIDCQAPPGYLKRYRSEGMTFSDIAGLLGVTVDRVRQLSRIAATDQRLVVSWHPRKKNTKIFRLSRWDTPGL
jgi:DNA-directed RNA polymerase sigma subunit (sigma70/sigma32)